MMVENHEPQQQNLPSRMPVRLFHWNFCFRFLCICMQNGQFSIFQNLKSNLDLSRSYFPAFCLDSLFEMQKFPTKRSMQKRR